MAKTKQDKQLYSSMRERGLRKRVARELSELPAHVAGGKPAPKPLREAVDRLEGLVRELKRHTDGGERKAALPTRAQGGGRGRAAAPAKSRSGASSAKSRSVGSITMRNIDSS